MRFYGVGTTMGGESEGERIDEYLKHNFWCMGFTDEAKPNYARLIEKIEIGDILVAKAHHHSSDYYVKAIGIVTGKNPDNIPEEFKDKSGVSVIWFKKFEPFIQLSKTNFKIGGNRTHTIYHENDEQNILMLKKIMKYDYNVEV